MENVVIIQRVVPHYRVPLFKELHRQFGWRVVSASNPPANTSLSLCREEEFLYATPYLYPCVDREYLAIVPVKQIIEELKPRAIIAEFSLQMSSTWQLVMSHRLRRGRPILFWSHGPTDHWADNTLASLVINKIKRTLAERADAHITYTEGGRKRLLQETAVRRCFVATNSLDVAAIRQAGEPCAPLQAPGSPVVVAIGRITQDKNMPGLLQAFAIFRQNFSRAVLYVIGGGPGWAALKSANEAAGDTGVILLGPLYEEVAIAPYLKAADICVIPGAAGLSVNHALAYGVPVVLFEQSQSGPRHHPEVEYVVNDVTGWRVGPATPEALAAKLVDLFSRTPWPRPAIAANLRRYVDQNIMLENMVDGFRRVNEFLDAGAHEGDPQHRDEAHRAAEVGSGLGPDGKITRRT